MKIFLFVLFCAFILTACGGGATTLSEDKSATPTNSTASGLWEKVSIIHVDQNVMAAGFLTEEYGVTAGTYPGLMFTTTDGGRHWSEGTNLSDCRYGLDIVDKRVGWTSGGAMNVRRSTDGGQSWLPVSDYGIGTTQPFHTISFLDDTTGWIASLYMFGSTGDGGSTWTDVPLPNGIDDIASILLVEPDTGYLLDFSGNLFFTTDNGWHWVKLSSLDLGGLIIPKAAYQMAAIRFYDPQNGLIVVSEDYQKGKVKAFHTQDGGRTWKSELVPVVSGPVFLSRLMPLLTVLNGADQLTLLRYIAR